MEHASGEHKDWTWVLDRPCDECGYDADALDRNELGAALRSNAATWRGLLGRGDVVVERPPSPGGEVVWSALEYGAHVRDVYERFVERLSAILGEDEPTFVDWDQNVAAIEGRYHEQDPGRVAYTLAATAGRVADMVDRVQDDAWARTGRRSDGASFTAESLVRYMLHDVTHHVADVERGYKALLGDDG